MGAKVIQKAVEGPAFTSCLLPTSSLVWGYVTASFPFQLNRDNAGERRGCDPILLVMTAELLRLDVLASSRNEV